jgi:Copper transport outer membrane protein, MctB
VEQLRVLVGEPLLVIDFRYHLVSLIAVFLAVALGIVIGTTALNNPISADIEARVDQLEQDKRQLEDRTQELTTEIESADAFEQAVAPALVDGTLEGRSVVVLATSDEVAPELLEQVGGLLTEAGASVTGVVRLLPEYSDPATAAGLRDYVTSPGTPPGVVLPETDDAGQLVGALLAQALMIPTEPGATAADPDDVSSVLAGLSALDVVTLESSSVEPADYAVVLTGGGFDSDAEERNGTLIELVTALDSAGSGAVVAGTSASARENGLVGAIRADPELAAAVSTVDNVDRAAGRISTVLALGQEAEGTSGMYGNGEDTQPVPPVPDAVPAP